MRQLWIYNVLRQLYARIVIVILCNKTIIYSNGPPGYFLSITVQYAMQNIFI